MEVMGINNLSASFWKDKKVFVTGHTGFKGSWLCLLLNHFGAKVYGYALEPSTKPSLFRLAGIDEMVYSSIGNICDLENVKQAVLSAQPDIVIHMAAQPLVRYSYTNPVETFQVNVMGTVNLLEAVRNSKARAVVNVTTDKCYQNNEWYWSYRENEALGGYDPYSSSKACSELVTAAYKTSFFNPLDTVATTFIASARAGNVIGGGDWAADRLIPDFVRAIQQNDKIIIRNPDAVRPWQHVLEPLTGYLTLAEKLYNEGSTFAEAWNFGPDDSDVQTVEWIVRQMCIAWGNNMSYELTSVPQPHEATYLKLDCSKAKNLLGWKPRWNLKRTLESIIIFTKAHSNKENIREVCLAQITDYLQTK
jgi:CDP-glucose 4,6-dehydratase